MVPVVATKPVSMQWVQKPHPDIALVPVSKEGRSRLFIKVNTKESTEKGYTEEEKGHIKSPLEEGTSGQPHAPCPGCRGERGEERGKRRESLGLTEGSEAP